MATVAVHPAAGRPALLLSSSGARRDLVAGAGRRRQAVDGVGERACERGLDGLEEELAAVGGARARAAAAALGGGGGVVEGVDPLASGDGADASERREDDGEEAAAELNTAGEVLGVLLGGAIGEER